jgi:uncharacterized OB-fold protein
MSSPAYNKPLPTPQPESDFYWQKAREHELWLRRCDDCRQGYFYPRDICPECFSRNTSWVQSSGRGTLHTFAIVHRTPHPAFQAGVPYVVAIVELEDGVRIPTNLVDVEPAPTAIHVGMPVVVTFDDVTDEITLPKFKPAGSS